MKQLTIGAAVRVFAGITGFCLPEIVFKKMGLKHK